MHARYIHIINTPIMMKRKIALETICFLIVVLFLYTGFSKLLGHQNFVKQMSLSSLLEDVAIYVSWFIPCVEILIAVLLTIPRTRRAGMWGAFVLMTAFTLYVLLILWFSEKLPCSCGGVLQSLNWREHLVFNLFYWGLAAMGVTLLYAREEPFRIHELDS